jgi:hypothetical protein
MKQQHQRPLRNSGEPCVKGFSSEDATIAKKGLTVIG